MQLVEIRKRLSCQIKQRHSAELVEMDSELMALITAQITELESCISEDVSHCDGLAKRAAILRSIPGVGPVLTATFIGELPELGECSHKHVAALVGLAPMNNDSGKKSVAEPYAVADTQFEMCFIRPPWSLLDTTQHSMHLRSA